MKNNMLARIFVSAVLSVVFLAIPAGGAHAMPFITPVDNYTAGTGPMSVCTGDFDRDGILDLAVANYDGNNISILSGNSSGGFGAAANYGTLSQPYCVAAGDFDRDGDLDLAVANSGDDGSLGCVDRAGPGFGDCPVHLHVVLRGE